MVTFNNNQVQFQTNDRGWKGVSVVMILNNSIHDPSVLSDGRPIYLCIGHFRSRKSAESLCDKLNAGEITPKEAAIKSMKRYIKWVKNPRGFGGGWCIGRDQLVYFGATPSDVAQYDAAKEDMSCRIRAEIEERKQKSASL